MTRVCACGCVHVFVCVSGEEKTLGLTIETGKTSSRVLDEKIDLEACGEETKARLCCSGRLVALMRRLADLSLAACARALSLLESLAFSV